MTAIILGVVVAVILGTAADRAVPKPPQEVQIQPFVCQPFTTNRGESRMVCFPIEEAE